MGARRRGSVMTTTLMTSTRIAGVRALKFWRWRTSAAIQAPSFSWVLFLTTVGGPQGSKKFDSSLGAGWALLLIFFSNRRGGCRAGVNREEDGKVRDS